MLSYFNRKMNKKGFTLIELIVVIAIIGILIAIAVPRLSGFTGQATTAAEEATARTIKSSVAIILSQAGVSNWGDGTSTYDFNGNGTSTSYNDELDSMIDGGLPTSVSDISTSGGEIIVTINGTDY